MNEPETFRLEGWAIVEIMGHNSVAGYIQRDGSLILVSVPEAPAIEGGEEDGYIFKAVEARPAERIALGEGAVYRVTMTTQQVVEEYLLRKQTTRRQGYWKRGLIGARDDGDDFDGEDDRDGFDCGDDE